jgi:hypothetical protein
MLAPDELPPVHELPRFWDGGWVISGVGVGAGASLCASVNPGNATAPSKHALATLIRILRISRPPHVS